MTRRIPLSVSAIKTDGRLGQGLATGFVPMHVAEALAHGRELAHALSRACGGAEIRIEVRRRCGVCTGQGTIPWERVPAGGSCFCPACEGTGHTGVITSETYSEEKV